MSYLVIAHEETPRYEGAPTVAPYRVSTINHFLPITAGSVRGVPQMRDRNDELRGNLSPMASLVDSFAPAGSIAVGGYMTAGIVLCSLTGMTLTGVAGDGVNAVHTIASTGTVSGGTFDLVVAADADLTVTGIPWDTTAAALQTLIDQRIRRSGAGAWQLGDVVVGGGPFPGTALALTFQGTHAAKAVTLSTVTGTGLTGTTPGATATATTAGAIGTTTLPDGSGVPTGAYRWQSAKATGATPQSAQVIAAYSEAAAYELGQGFCCSQLSMDNAGNWSGTMLGLVGKGADDPALTPTYDTPTVEPLLSSDKIVSWRGGTTDVSELTWQLANPVAAVANYGTRSRYPGKLRYDDGFLTMTGAISIDAYDSAARDALLEAQVFSASSHWRTRSKVGSSGALYQMFAEMPSCQIVGGDGPIDLSARRSWTSSYNWMAAYDQAAGYDFRFTFVSGLTSLLSYT